MNAIRNIMQYAGLQAYTYEDVGFGIKELIEPPPSPDGWRCGKTRAIQRPIAQLKLVLQEIQPLEMPLAAKYAGRCGATKKSGKKNRFCSRYISYEKMH
jgi:hypothetical protein